MIGSVRGAWGRWMTGAAVVAALGWIAAIGGCGQRTDTAATPAGDEAATDLAGDGGAGTPINLRWDSAANCLTYTPAVDSLRIGQSVNFNSSVQQEVTVTAPAGCFSVADTTFVIPQTGPGPTLRAYSAGSYQLTYNPGPCPGDTGGTGPNIIINEGR